MLTHMGRLIRLGLAPLPEIVLRRDACGLSFMQGGKMHLDHGAIANDGQTCTPLQSLPEPLPSAALLLDWNATIVPGHSSQEIEIQVTVSMKNLHCEAQAGM